MFDRIRARLAFALQPKGTNLFNDAFLSMLGGVMTKYDANSKTYIESGYNINSDVYSVVNQIARKCSDIPYSIKTVKDENSAKSYRLIKASTSFKHLVKKVSLEIKAFEEKEMMLPLEVPNSEQSWSEFIALSAVMMKATGNCFWYTLSPTERENAPPQAIYVLPSQMVYIVVKDKPSFLGIESPISHYKLIEGNQFIDFKEDQIIHIKNPNPNFDMEGSHLYGQSDLRAALKNIQCSNEAINNNIKTQNNGGAFGFIHSKGQNTMTSDQARAIKERLTEMDSNPDRLSKIAGVSAELGFTRISLTTDELKPFDFLAYDQKAICNVLGWSTKLLNSTEGSTGLNNGMMEEERKRVVTDTVMPLLNQFEEAINNKFLPRFKGYDNTVIEFDPSELPEMQGDMEKLAKWANEGVDRGTLSRDEWRMIMNFMQIGTPEMQAYTVAMNVMSLEDALIPLENDLTIEDES